MEPSSRDPSSHAIHDRMSPVRACAVVLACVAVLAAVMAGAWLLMQSVPAKVARRPRPSPVTERPTSDSSRRAIDVTTLPRTDADDESP